MRLLAGATVLKLRFFFRPQPNSLGRPARNAAVFKGLTLTRIYRTRAEPRRCVGDGWLARRLANVANSLATFDKDPTQATSHPRLNLPCDSCHAQSQQVRSAKSMASSRSALNATRHSNTGHLRAELGPSR